MQARCNFSFCIWGLFLRGKIARYPSTKMHMHMYNINMYIYICINIDVIFFLIVLIYIDIYYY